MNQPGHPLRPKKSGNTIAIKDRLWRELFKGLACRPVASRAAEGGGEGKRRKRRGRDFKALRPVPSPFVLLRRQVQPSRGMQVSVRVLGSLREGRLAIGVGRLVGRVSVEVGEEIGDTSMETNPGLFVSSFCWKWDFGPGCVSVFVKEKREREREGGRVRK